jgi:hypothetical protein
VTIVATSLLFCFCNILAGLERAESLTLDWRVSGVVLTGAFDPGIYNSDQTSTVKNDNKDYMLVRFMCQLYVSMRFLAIRGNQDYCVYFQN